MEEEAALEALEGAGEADALLSRFCSAREEGRHWSSQVLNRLIAEFALPVQNAETERKSRAEQQETLHQSHQSLQNFNTTHGRFEASIC